MRVKMESSQEACEVCGDRPAKFGHGAVSCKLCKIFLYCHTKGNARPVEPCANGDKCPVTGAPDCCKSCKLKRMLNLGMRYECRMANDSYSYERSSRNETGTPTREQPSRNRTPNEEQPSRNRTPNEGPPSRNATPIEEQTTRNDTPQNDDPPPEKRARISSVREEYNMQLGKITDTLNELRTEYTEILEEIDQLVLDAQQKNVSLGRPLHYDLERKIFKKMSKLKKDYKVSTVMIDFLLERIAQNMDDDVSS